MWHSRQACRFVAAIVKHFCCSQGVQLRKLVYEYFWLIRSLCARTESRYLLLTLHPVHLANLANPASGSEKRHIPVPTDVVPPYDYVENDNVDFGFTRRYVLAPTTSAERLANNKNQLEVICGDEWASCNF